ncbi:zinc finger and SCAN domain-containing protein 25-like isoform X2 [Entelurus aequoreus]|uniref:zinc finger and SCAN domain-containing protein 25-like isoform X2 n=1 Tax=Entelurus aequoreus TaxID=161455 RepID=UPI002B1E78B2|nr:zinc finger and SCAN domain-containing protein 25-like isoform X2 [Entelurus aequoreus]
MSSMKRMVEWEDPQTFLDVFEATATSCKWPEEEWGAKLLPLLVGEAQRAGLSLPATARMQYPDLRHAILDRVGSSPEDHRRKFRAIKLGPEDQPFVLAYRMRDAATRWLEPNGLDSKMLESIILEQFIDALPAKTSAWVQYHSSPDVKTAVKMAEEHLAVQREATAKTAERPTPAPRPAMGGVEGTSREQRPRTAEPPGANEQGTGAAERGLPSQMAPQTPGPVCWGCGQPGHVRRECSMMEVGQVMRVVGPPAPDLGETYCVPAH